MKIWILLLTTQLCFAFKLTPLSQSIVLGQSSNTVVYQVQNKNKQPVALEISLKSREMNIDGIEKRASVSEDDFLLYPEQIILKPGQKRGVKIKWLGGDISSEKSFRVVAEQLPLDFKKKKETGINLLLKYVGALYVTKSEFKDKLSLSKVYEEKGNLIFQVTNSGLKHKILKKLKVTFKKNDKTSFTLSGKELNGFTGQNVLAKTKRNFKIKTPTKLSSLDISKGKFSISYE